MFLFITTRIKGWQNLFFQLFHDIPFLFQSYDKNLSSGADWTAHESQVFALSAANGFVYSSSYDGGVRVWSAKGDKIAELPPTGGDIGDLCVHENQLISGDESGNVGNL